MTRPEDSRDRAAESVGPELVRALLCKLRDANLHLPHLATGGASSVSIAGCLSPDAPADRAIGYLLRWPDGTEEVLSIAPSNDSLSLAVCDRAGRPLGTARSIVLVSDGEGGLLSRDCRARIDPSAAGPRELERFFRRLVRGVLGKDAA